MYKWQVNIVIKFLTILSHQGIHIQPYWETFQNNQNVYNHKQTNNNGYVGGIYSYNVGREADQIFTCGNSLKEFIKKNRITTWANSTLPEKITQLI